MPSLSRRTRLLALLPAVGLVLAACGSGNNAASSTSGGDIVIGGVVGSSGAYGIIGVNMINAAQLAVAKINSSGGLLGKKVTFISYNDQGDPTLGSQLFQRVVSAGAIAVVGSGDTGPATAAEAEKLQIPDIGVVDGGGPTVYPDGPGTPPLKWVFDFSTSTYELGGKLAAYSLQHCTATALLHDQTSYGEGAAQAIVYAYKQAGKSLALNDTITENWATSSPVDITPEVRRVQSSGADCVIPWLTPEDAAAYVRTASSLGVHMTVLGNDDAYGDTTYPTLAGPAANGTISAELTALVHPSAALLAYQQQYESQFHATPDIYGEQSYDAIMMLAQVVKQIGSTNPQKIQAAMQQVTNYQGITGILGFSPTDHESALPTSFSWIRYSTTAKAWVPFTPSA